MRVIAIVTASLLLTAPAAAQQMNAEEFHRRATALKAKGPLALFSKDEITVLMTEGQNAGKAARARRTVALAAGKPAAFCPPSGKQSMGSDEFMTRLSAIPQAERRKMDMTDAMTRILEVKFPCSR